MVPGAGVCLAEGQTSGDVEAVHLTGPPPEQQRGEARAEASPPGLPLAKMKAAARPPGLPLVKARTKAKATASPPGQLT